MVFNTDTSVQRKGFFASHSTACGGHLRATNKVKHIYSHAKFGAGMYDNGADCEWSIEADRDKNVQLKFLTFDVEEERMCSYDYVEVYGGLDDASGPLHGKYCGNSVSISEETFPENPSVTPKSPNRTPRRSSR